MNIESMKFRKVWRWPALKVVTSARDFRRPTFFLNRYPGVVIGVAAYYRQRGLSLLWARPGGLK
jgi:hypothetical protein